MASCHMDMQKERCVIVAHDQAHKGFVQLPAFMQRNVSKQEKMGGGEKNRLSLM